MGLHASVLDGCAAPRTVAGMDNVTIDLPPPLSGTWTLPGSGGAALLLWAVVGILLLLFSFDAATLTFRGTRDYIHLTLGKALLGARISATIGALVVFFSGWGPLLAVVAYLSGVPIFGIWGKKPDSDTS